MNKRSLVESVDIPITVTLRCRRQIDNYLPEHYILECLGFVVSGKNEAQAISRLEKAIMESSK